MSASLSLGAFWRGSFGGGAGESRTVCVASRGTCPGRGGLRVGGASKVGGLGRVGRQRVRGPDSGGEGVVRGVEAGIEAGMRFVAGMRAAAAARALGRVRRWRTKVFIAGGDGGGAEAGVEVGGGRRVESDFWCT